MAIASPPPRKLPDATVSWWAVSTAFVVWAVLASAGVWLAVHGWQAPPDRAGAERSPMAQSPAQAIDWRIVTQALGPSTVTQPRAEVPALRSPLVNSTVKVQGVVVPEAALLQIGSEPSRPYKVGQEVPGLGWLVGVSASEVQFASQLDGPVDKRLDVPQRPVKSPGS